VRCQPVEQIARFACIGCRSPKEPKWDLSTDEINFFIAGGMTLSREIYEKLKEEEE